MGEQRRRICRLIWLRSQGGCTRPRGHDAMTDAPPRISSSQAGLPAGRRPAGGHRAPGRGPAQRPRAPDAARRHRLGQDLHHRQRDPAGAAPDAGDGAQQDAGRAAVRRVQGVLPEQRGRVLRLATTTTTSPRPTCRPPTPTSRRTPRSTSTSSRCACRPPRRCSSGRDAIIVATVSAIYGLGDPQAYLSMVLHLVRGDRLDQRELLRRLADMQYTRNELDLTQGTYRVRGDVIDIFPAESEREAVRVELFDDEIEALSFFDPLTGEVLRKVPRSPCTRRRTTSRRASASTARSSRSATSCASGSRSCAPTTSWLEAQRLRAAHPLRPRDDDGGRLLRGHRELLALPVGPRRPGEPPPTLFDYLPDECAAGDRREPRHHPADRRHVPGRPLAQGDAGASTASACRRRSTTGRCASTSGRRWRRR